MSEKTGSPQLFPWLKFTCASPEVFGEYSDLLKAEAELRGWKDKCHDMSVKLVEMREALVLILPLAKGYAAEHPVGSNQEYVTHAETILGGET